MMVRREDSYDSHLAQPPPPPPGDWVEEGLCGALVHDKKYEWFPEDDDWNRPEVHRARATCNRCPVRAECARYALEHKIRHGMWGGLTEMDRGFFPTKPKRKRSVSEKSRGVNKCPGCGSQTSIVPKGRGYLTCASCKSSWPGTVLDGVR